MENGLVVTYSLTHSHTPNLEMLSHLKIGYDRSLTHLQVVRASKSKKDIGEEISRLQLAETNLQSSKATLPAKFQGKIEYYFVSIISKSNLDY